MSKKSLFVLWGVLFILCAGLGFIPEPKGIGKVLMTILSVVFFLPGGVLLYTAWREKDSATLQLLRNLSALSLSLTLVLLVGNVLSALGSETLGNMLYFMLVIVSSPMVCSGYWVLSLFLWACLLMASLSRLKRIRKMA